MYDIPQALSCKEISDYLGVFGWILYQRLVSVERVSNVQNTPIRGVISITGGKRGDSLIPPVQGCLLALCALLGVQHARYPDRCITSITGCKRAARMPFRLFSPFRHVACVLYPERGIISITGGKRAKRVSPPELTAHVYLPR